MVLVEPGKGVDLCSIDPGYEVDLYVTTNLRTTTEVWMGYTTIARAKADKRLVLAGDRQLQATLQIWLGSSRFADMEKCVAWRRGQFTRPLFV